MKKALALILVLLSILPLVAACQSSEQPSETTDAPTEGPAATEDPYKDYVPDTNYNEYTFLIAAPSPDEWGISSYDRKEENAETINDAIYQRNRQLEGRFNITIDTLSLGQTTMAGPFQTYKVANEDKIDLLAVCYFYDSRSMVINDDILPWNDVPYINLEREWWNASISKTLSILDNYYLIVGDVNWFTMPETAVCYFNKEVAADHKETVGNLYQLVNDHEWTFDKAYDIAKAIANDSNGDGIINENDTFGAIQNIAIGVTGFVYAANYETVVMTESGPEMRFLTTKMKNIVDYVYKFCYENNVSYTSRFDFIEQSQGVSIFFDDRALLYFDCLMHAEKFRDRDSDFGIIPYPLYDKEQEKYTSYSNSWGLSCALPCTATDVSRTGAILEAMCALSAKLIVPAYYEKTLMGKIKRDDESEEMLDMIFSNILYDFGICYITHLKWIPVENLIQNRKNNITSWYRGQKTQLEANYQSVYDHVLAKKNGTA